MRPSCGRRRSAMSRFAMILIARDHRGREAARRRLDFVQHAVDPVAHGQPVLERLDVDVRRARFERVGDDERHEADDRRLGREVLQVLDVGVESELVALLDVADDLADRRAARAVEALERRVELRWESRPAAARRGR